MKLKLISFRMLLLLICFFIIYPMQGKSKDEEQIPVYEITCGGSGLQGYYIVKVSVFVNKPSEINDNILCKCAVHGILFRGYSGEQGCTSQPPLAGSAIIEQQKADFFDAFFTQGGNYTNYATMIDGSLQAERVNKQYKATAIISVAKDQLRKDLEQAGIIKGLSNGF